MFQTHHALEEGALVLIGEKEWKSCFNIAQKCVNSYVNAGKLSEVDRFLSRFASTIAHQLLKLLRERDARIGSPLRKLSAFLNENQTYLAKPTIQQYVSSAYRNRGDSLHVSKCLKQILSPQTSSKSLEVAQSYYQLGNKNMKNENYEGAAKWYWKAFNLVNDHRADLADMYYKAYISASQALNNTRKKSSRPASASRKSSVRGSERIISAQSTPKSQFFRSIERKENKESGKVYKLPLIIDTPGHGVEVPIKPIVHQIFKKPVPVKQPTPPSKISEAEEESEQVSEAPEEVPVPETVEAPETTIEDVVSKEVNIFKHEKQVKLFQKNFRKFMAENFYNLKLKRRNKVRILNRHFLKINDTYYAVSLYHNQVKIDEDYAINLHEKYVDLLKYADTKDLLAIFAIYILLHKEKILPVHKSLFEKYYNKKLVVKKIEYVLSPDLFGKKLPNFTFYTNQAEVKEAEPKGIMKTPLSSAVNSKSDRDVVISVHENINSENCVVTVFRKDSLTFVEVFVKSLKLRVHTQVPEEYLNNLSGLIRNLSLSPDRNQILFVPKPPPELCFETSKDFNGEHGHISIFRNTKGYFATVMYQEKPLHLYLGEDISMDEVINSLEIRQIMGQDCLILNNF